MWRSIGSVTYLVLFMVGCGGGDSGAPSAPATFTVGGTVTGLSGPGLVLHSNFGGDLAISASGSFTFSTRLPFGSTFVVGIKTQPTSPNQDCQVANGIGTIAAANVTTVIVTCQSGYRIHGTVSGLVGSGLTLGVCPSGGGGHGAPPPACHSGLQIGANGAFTLDAFYPADYSGDDYIAILQQPSSPAQNCGIFGVTSVIVQTLSNTSVSVSCPGEYAYVTNAADNTLWSYSVDGTTGALAVIGAPTATGASPHAVVAYYCCGEGPYTAEYVYVGNEGSNDISAFAVDIATGALTAVPGSPFPAGTDPQAMTLYGNLLYVANAGSDNVSAYIIDNSTGALTAMPGSPVAVGKSPTSIVATPDNGIVYVANHGGSNDISAFHLDLSPVPGSPYPAGGNPLSLGFTFWQGGMFLYSANPDPTSSSLSVFSVNGTTGAFSPLSGAPLSLPVSHYMNTTPVGFFTSIWRGDSHTIPYLYATSGAGIVGYASDIATGALTALPGFPVSTGANAYSVSINPTNQFLYVANEGAANISGFRLNALTGALTPMAGSPFPAGSHPQFIAMF